MSFDNTPINDGIKLAAAAAAAAAAVIVGSMVLLGWIFDIGVLKSILPGWVSMKANAAVCFILIGIALSLVTHPPETLNPQRSIFFSRLARLCGLLVGLIGMLTLCEYIFGWNTGIDQWLFREQGGTTGTSDPGRMAPETALCFVLLSVALWITGASRKTYRSILVSVNLSLLVMTIALAAMLSYAMPGLGPYGWFGLTVMALHTSLLFALLGVAVIANSWQQDVLQWSLSRNTTAAFACGMALLVFIGLNTSRSQFWLNETNSKIAYSEEVLSNIVSLQTELVEAQAHTRGYIITGNAGFLTAYLADMNAYNSKVDALRPLVSGNPHQQQQLSLIETNADLLRRWSQQFIDIAQTGKGNAARSKMGAHVWDLLDNIRSTFDQIENEQQQLINRMKQESESVTRFAYISIAAGTFASLFIFLVVIFRLNFAVNERKQLEGKQKLFRTLLDNSSDAIEVLDSATLRFSDMNETGCRDLGYSREELLSMSVSDIDPASNADFQKMTLAQLRQSGSACFEGVHRRKDGSTFPVEISSKWIELDKPYLLNIVRDITKRKAMEMRLRESEEKFRALFDNATDGISLADMEDKKLLLGNATFCRMLGYAPEEISKLHVMDIHPANGLPYVLSEFERQAKEGKAVAENIPVKRKDGSVFYAEITTAFFKTDGKTYLAGFFRDISERKKAEEALRQIEADLKTLVEHSPVAIIVDVGVDADEKIMMMNRKFTELFGYTMEDVPDVLHWWPLAYPDETYREAVKAEWIGKVGKAIQSHCDIEPMETTVSCKDGSKRYIRFSLSSIGNRNIITFEDLTERKQAEGKIHKLNEELEAKVQERTKQLLDAQEELVRKEKLAVLGQVAGSVGHELRNPLGVMSNAVYFLQTVLADADETTKEYLDIIKDEIAGSERIVSDLLDSVRTQPPHPEAVGVAELIEQTLRKCSVPASVTVKLDIPATLPPLRVDPQQIHQVFRNLISNGIEAMPEDGTLEIRAVENKQDGTITISVRDSGIGMTPEQLGKLFQPLFTTKARGIGLGLVVVKNLIEANGGAVEVESEVGKGTVFTITLPADDVGRDSACVVGASAPYNHGVPLAGESRHVANPVGLKTDLQTKR